MIVYWGGHSHGVENSGCQRWVKRIVKGISDVSFIHQNSNKDPEQKYLLCQPARMICQKMISANTLSPPLSIYIIQWLPPLIAFLWNERITKYASNTAVKNHARGKTYQLQADLNIDQTHLSIWWIWWLLDVTIGLQNSGLLLAISRPAPPPARSVVDRWPVGPWSHPADLANHLAKTKSYGFIWIRWLRMIQMD